MMFYDGNLCAGSYINMIHVIPSISLNLLLYMDPDRCWERCADQETKQKVRDLPVQST